MSRYFRVKLFTRHKKTLLERPEVIFLGYERRFVRLLKYEMKICEMFGKAEKTGKLSSAHLWVIDVSPKLTVKTTVKCNFVLNYICEWYGCCDSQSPKTLPRNQKGSSRVYFDYQKENVPWPVPTLLAERAADVYSTQRGSAHWLLARGFLQGVF